MYYTKPSLRGLSPDSACACLSGSVASGVSFDACYCSGGVSVTEASSCDDGAGNTHYYRYCEVGGNTDPGNLCQSGTSVTAADGANCITGTVPDSSDCILGSAV